jgi:amino acid adenylation domain-containing protein
MSDDVCLPDLLHDRVRARPDDPAVVSGGHTLTFRGLAERASGLARRLQQLGVAGDDCVGLFTEPSMDLIVGAWGILLSGGAYLPLSPEYPEERLRYMIEDARVGVIVAQETLVERLTELVPPGTRIVTLAEAIEAGGILVDSGRRPGDLAYVIYTSGSTGKPKGVMIEQRSVVNQMRWLADAYGLGPGRTVVQKTPMSFDAAQWEILAPACGARVVMGTPGIYRDPESLIDTIVANEVTALQCVPTLLQALLDTEEFDRCTSLTQVFTGGEVLSKPLATAFLDAMPGCELVNLYGPTECTINSSAFTVDSARISEGPNAISIGRPVRDTQYHILDEQRRPVAVGEVGELYVGGVQVGRGYLHRPDLTEERFVANPFDVDGRSPTLFRTGDLASWNDDGTVQFVGRADNQVKLRGFRVELDEIKLAIETHDWVRHAAVIVKDDPRTGFQNLIACVELNPKEAALMDQGNHGAHHQSKENKFQVKAQLSNPGRRGAESLIGKPVVELPGTDATDWQKKWVFLRKTYRFFEGGEVSRDDILQLLGQQPQGIQARAVSDVSFAEFGVILRSFGNCVSDERLLPKYAYASPGSLYATQLYVEVDRMDGLAPGYYYYHPGKHELVLIRPKVDPGTAGVRFHFVGKRGAIEPVYKNNILEVLEIETGHMVGLFDKVLPLFGLDIAPTGYLPSEMDHLECADEDHYLGTFELVSRTGPRQEAVDVYVQAHAGKVIGLPAGQYAYRRGELELISPELVLRKHVIAINQQVYDRASFGISVISRNEEWLQYIDLGRKLQLLSMSDLPLGFMSSGYSSKSGAPLPAATRIDSILADCGRPVGPSYFFVGGRVSDEQRYSRGMKEDVVHMRGPAELIRDDLVNYLPDYMIPNKVLVQDRLPFTANGKIDVKALAASDKTDVGVDDRPFVPSRTTTERQIAAIWAKAMRHEDVSVQDDFFAAGGNSLIAVTMINRINRELGTALPLQVLFENPTVELLARRVDGTRGTAASRLVPLQGDGNGEPIYCWPGLGGYPMNLRELAGVLGTERPFYGVQAYGINAGETPFPTIQQMAAEDVEEITRRQPVGPYTLWGYSFGARVAFEAAYQLEMAGERVEHLFLVAPGSPKVRAVEAAIHGRQVSYANKAYVTILFSVFAGSISDPALPDCLAAATDDESFVAFVHQRFSNLEPDVVRRIVGIVAETFEFEYSFRELEQRRISAPVTIFKARGDDYSFLENATGYSVAEPTVVELEADHYTLLRQPDVGELVAAIRQRLVGVPASRRPEAA